MAKPCPKPVNEHTNLKNVLEQLEDVCRRLVFWRDGGICVEQEMDGRRCYGPIQWGHFIPRKQSKFLKYDLGNTFCQCAGHNNLHDKGAQTMGVWYAQTLGEQAHSAIEAAARLNVGRKIYVSDYREMLERYIYLYENRPTAYRFTQLIEYGYYGEIVKLANSMVQYCP